MDLNVENIGHFNKKYPCRIFWDAQKDGSAQWKGYVSRIEKINETSRTVRVVVEVPENKASSNLTKGMFCRVVIPGKHYKNAIAIPSSALRINDTVYILKKGKLQIKKVEVFQRFDGKVVIDSGISSGDRVIVSALSNPVTGMQLKTPPNPKMTGSISINGMPCQLSCSSCYPAKK